jgi:hypothetical protein
MTTTTDKRGGAVRSIRLLTGIAALDALALTAFGGTASAKTVYDYVYSGTYLDGSGAGHTFGEGIGGLEYVPSSQDLYVAESGSSPTITRLTEAGSGAPFSKTGTASVPVSAGYGPARTQVSVDQSGGPNAGNMYASVASSWTGFTPDGGPLPGFSGSNEQVCGIAPEPDGETIIVSDREGIHHYNTSGEEVEKADYAGSPGLEPNTKRKWAERGSFCKEVFNNEGEIYGIKQQGGELGGDGNVIKITPHGLERYWLTTYYSPPNWWEVQEEEATAVAVDHSNDDVFVVQKNGTFEAFDSEGRTLGNGWGAPDAGRSYLGLAGESEGITIDPATHDVWVTNRRDYGSGVRHVEKFIPVNPHVIPDTTAISPEYSDPTGNTIVFRGILNPDGQETTGCYFEYGTTQALGSTAPCAGSENYSSEQEVKSSPAAVTKGKRYWYRLVAKNSNGQLAKSNPEAFLPQGKPILDLALVDRISTDGIRANAEFDPNGGNASFHIEYGVKGGPLDHTSPETDTVGFTTNEQGVFYGEDLYEPGIYLLSQLITGLTPDTSYEYRIVVTNEAGSTYSQPGEFRTYKPDAGSDSCSNALARQQTGSSLLLDCRGYELASASNAGGFDVESSTVPGEEPLMAYPRAEGRVLYSLHDGVVPGVAGSPTNLGRDPYVAVRGANGWTTKYVGLPSDAMADPGAFGSPLYGANPALTEFAFGGEDICDPCFGDGSTNIPLRLTDGSLVKGMQGSEAPGSAGNPAETVWQPFSADGTHFIFGSKAKFDARGSSSGSIYDRDLSSGETQVVSTLPSGSAIAGGEVAELAVSADGSRIVVGKQLSTDGAGNALYRLYMHLGESSQSVDLTPDASEGVLFDGMDESGRRIFFTTKDQLLSADQDESADAYEAEVNPVGSPSLRLVSTRGGAPSNDDSCAPSGSPSWNSPAGDGKCGAVGFAGGAGIAAGSGTFFFLSPELLDGSEGSADEANLYVVAPGGNPKFVGTIAEGAIDNEAIQHAVDDNATRSYGDFQVTPNGRYAVFASDVPLTGYPTGGHYEIYRYEAGASKPLVCASCAPTGSASGFDTFLTANGLNLTDDGRVFFTTLEALALRDTNELTDAYEWAHGETQLVSTGISADNSGLVTVSADGKDAYFFTRDVLAAGDENGRAVKIYDAREGGGFVHDPDRKACAASDECHGPSSQPPGPPNINTVTGSGRGHANHRPKRCKRGFVRRHGKCVKKHRRHRKHRGHRKHHRHHRHAKHERRNG